MPLIVTPRQLTQRAELYHQLATTTQAGLGLISALEMVRDSPPHRSFRKPLDRVVQELQQGASFADAMGSLGSAWLPTFELALVRAGETSGRLDVCFRFLSEYYGERAALVRRVLSDLTYPALVLHLAILIFPPTLLIRLVWQGDVEGFILSKGAILLSVYSVILIGLYLTQAHRGDAWRSWLERLLQRVPVLGAARSNLALARLAITLESLLNAGVSIIEAWELAADASGSPALRRTVFAWKPDVLAGVTPAEAIRQSHAFPDLFANLYSTGEISGQLDQTLRRLYQYYQEEALRKLHAVAQWTPRFLYFGVVLLVAYQVVSFWLGYFSQINALTQ